MPFYVPAYDTEAVYPWWELGGQPYAPSSYPKAVSYEGQRLQECLAGIGAVAEVHLALDVPATFFVVAKLLETARSELVEILDQPLFDIQCHSYSHADVVRISEDEASLQHPFRMIHDVLGVVLVFIKDPEVEEEQEQSRSTAQRHGVRPQAVGGRIPGLGQAEIGAEVADDQDAVLAHGESLAKVRP